MSDERDDYDAEDQHLGGQEGQRDRELLDLAAKAAGYESRSDGKGGLTISTGSGRCRDWDPLLEDADAFRLQVDIGINLDFRAMRVRAYADEVPGAMEEEYDSDKRAATRRAIVRAAAAIGEAMP